MKKCLILGFLFLMLMCNPAHAAYTEVHGTISVTSGTASGSINFGDVHMKVLEIQAVTDDIDDGDTVSISLTDNFTDRTIFNVHDNSVTTATCPAYTVSTASVTDTITWSDSGVDEGTTTTVTVSGSSVGTSTVTDYYVVGSVKLTYAYTTAQGAPRTVLVKMIGEY